MRVSDRNSPDDISIAIAVALWVSFWLVVLLSGPIALVLVLL